MSQSRLKVKQNGILDDGFDAFMAEVWLIHLSRNIKDSLICSLFVSDMYTVFTQYDIDYIVTLTCFLHYAVFQDEFGRRVHH